MRRCALRAAAAARAPAAAATASQLLGHQQLPWALAPVLLAARQLATSAGGGDSSSGGGVSPADEAAVSAATGAYRRGWGAKVALPALSILQERIIERDAIVKLRAYHIGSRIHISQVLALAQQQGCRTNSGKDYCIIWLKPSSSRARFRQQQHQGADAPGSATGASSARLLNLQRLLQMLPPLKQAGAELPVLKRFDMRGLLVKEQQPGADVHDGGTAGTGSPSAVQLASMQQQEQQKQTGETWSPHIMIGWLPPHGPQQQKQQQQQQQPQQWPLVMGHIMVAPSLTPGASRGSEHLMPPLVVVYRYGSLVFAGTQAADEPSLIDAVVPPSVRYKAGGDSTWGVRDPILQSSKPAEEHMLVVDPAAATFAAKGPDQVILQLLDVGGVRVLTSVLAQSAALAFYERSVSRSLEHLAAWRERRRQSGQAQGGLLSPLAAWMTGTSGKHADAVMFRVIAASALVITEARQLLEMAEPAWHYAAYHELWRVAADDFELEPRFKALERKLLQVEQEAKHDVKHGWGRRYHKLEQSVVLLLAVSCLLAVLEVSKKALSKSSGGGERGGEAQSSGGAGDEAGAALLDGGSCNSDGFAAAADADDALPASDVDACEAGGDGGTGDAAEFAAADDGELALAGAGAGREAGSGGTRRGWWRWPRWGSDRWQQ